MRPGSPVIFAQMCILGLCLCMDVGVYMGMDVYMDMDMYMDVGM